MVPAAHYTNMEHETGTYFREHEQTDVKGFTIIGTVESSDEYHIAEKWIANADEDDSGEASSPPENDSWVAYHIPAASLQDRISTDKCEPVGTLSDEQFAAVCEKVDHDEVTPEKVKA